MHCALYNLRLFYISPDQMYKRRRVFLYKTYTYSCPYYRHFFRFWEGLPYVVYNSRYVAMHDFIHLRQFSFHKPIFLSCIIKIWTQAAKNRFFEIPERFPGNLTEIPFHVIIVFDNMCEPLGQDILPPLSGKCGFRMSSGIPDGHTHIQKPTGPATGSSLRMHGNLK